MEVVDPTMPTFPLMQIITSFSSSYKQCCKEATSQKFSLQTQFARVRPQMHLTSTLETSTLTPYDPKKQYLIA